MKNEVVVHGVLEEQIAEHRTFCTENGGTFCSQQAGDGTYSISCIYPPTEAESPETPVRDL
ncbi:hypothetical protein [uncultured Tateyamaria sp.]|uniref:hypothetical protein n=1 Tax=uncultured Tateyamaria sp. TaxID=455651 RepID=UPI00260E270D|nr:hypothetical protein [uncultured Tateyamaria sp.]